MKPPVRAYFFNRVRDQAMETWFGRRLGQQAALAKLGVDQALPLLKLINSFINY